MKIRFNGTSAVDVPGADDVQPGDVVDLADEVAVSLLGAGCSIDAEGVTTPAADPLWSLPAKAPKTEPKTDPAATAEKD